MDEHVTKTDNQLQTIANSIRAFYKGSELVEPHEFEEFSKEVLQDAPPIENMVVLQNGIVIQSYPDTGLVDSEFHVLFSNYITQMNGSNILLLQFPMGIPDAGDMSIIFAVSPSIFVESKTILGDSYKLVLSTSSETEKILYESMKINGQETVGAVSFSNNEIQNSIALDKVTQLVGYTSNENVAFRFIVWDSTFEKQLETYEYIMLIGGTITAFTVPAILIKSEKLNNQLKSTNKKLHAYAKKLKEVDVAKEEFSSMVTHELKTPLVPIQGYCGMLLDGTFGELTEKQKEKIKIIYNNSQRLLALIQDILDAHKLELGKVRLHKEEIDARLLVHQCVNTLEPSANEKGIQLVRNVDTNLKLKCDQKRILQVLNNLVGNAIKYVREKDGRIEVSAKQYNGSVVFSVKDNGIGIPRDKQENLFKKFYQVDTSLTRQPGGTGLGLAICKGIVEAHEGRIWVDSEEDKGSTFYFSIPAGGNGSE